MYQSRPCIILGDGLCKVSYPKKDWRQMDAFCDVELSFTNRLIKARLVSSEHPSFEAWEQLPIDSAHTSTQWVWMKESFSYTLDEGEV